MKLVKRLFLVFSAVMFALALLGYLRQEPERSRSSREPETVMAGSSREEGYFVRSEGLRLRVQPLGGGAARYIEGICVADLPAADREQLALGLTLPDEAALLALLEDYTG